MINPMYFYDRSILRGYARHSEAYAVEVRRRISRMSTKLRDVAMDYIRHGPSGHARRDEVALTLIAAVVETIEGEVRP